MRLPRAKAVGVSPLEAERRSEYGGMVAFVRHASMNRLAAFRCLLVLCLWQGPLPVCHAHGTLASEPEAARPWLAAHLETHHASVDPCELTFFGWHVHFEVPSSEGEPSETPGLSLRLPLIANTSADGIRVDWPSRLPVGGSAVPPLAMMQQLRDPQPIRLLRLGYFPDDAGSLPLPLRLGVARC